MGYTVKFSGLEELHGALLKKSQLQDAKIVVKKNGAGLQGAIQRHANFTKGYQTGTTKRSVGLEITDGGLTAKSGPTTEYSPYLEYGTRFMEAQPFVGPGFNEQKAIFKSDLKKLVR